MVNVLRVMVTMIIRVVVCSLYVEGWVNLCVICLEV